MNKKKMQILEAAKTLFARQGVQNTSINDIIALANVSKGTFYKYFTSKQACLIAILENVREKALLERELILYDYNLYNVESLKQQMIVYYNALIDSTIIDIIFNQGTSFNFSEEGANEVVGIPESFKMNALNELHWLANRLINIYGDRVATSAYDYASLILGGIQHVFLTQKLLEQRENLVQQIVEQSFTRLNTLIFYSPFSKQAILNAELFANLPLEEKQNIQTMENPLPYLEKFYEDNKEKFSEESVEYTLFLIDLLENSCEKKVIINTIALSFVKSFQKTEFVMEAYELLRRVKGELYKA